MGRWWLHCLARACLQAPAPAHGALSLRPPLSLCLSRYLCVCLSRSQTHTVTHLFSKEGRSIGPWVSLLRSDSGLFSSRVSLGKSFKTPSCLESHPVMTALPGVRAVAKGTRKCSVRVRPRCILGLRAPGVG